MSKQVANLIINDLKSLLKKSKLSIEECPVAPEVVGFLGRCIESGLLTHKQAKNRLRSIFEENYEAQTKEGI